MQKNKSEILGSIYGNSTTCRNCFWWSGDKTISVKGVDGKDIKGLAHTNVMLFVQKNEKPESLEYRALACAACTNESRGGLVVLDKFTDWLLKYKGNLPKGFFTSEFDYCDNFKLKNKSDA